MDSYVLDDEKDEIVLKIPDPPVIGSVRNGPLPVTDGTSGNQSTDDDLTTMEKLRLLFRKQANAKRAIHRYNNLDPDSVKRRDNKGYEYAKKALEEVPEQIASLKDILRVETRVRKKAKREAKSRWRGLKEGHYLNFVSEGRLSQSKQADCETNCRENDRRPDQAEYRGRSPLRMKERDRSRDNRPRSKDSDHRERREEYRRISPEIPNRSFNRKRMSSEERMLLNRSLSSDKGKQDYHRSARHDEDSDGETIRPKLEFPFLNEPPTSPSIAGSMEDQLPLTKEERKQMLMKKIEEARREVCLDYQNLSNLGKNGLAIANKTLSKQPILVDPKGLWKGPSVEKPAIETSCNHKENSRQQIQLELEKKILALLTPYEDHESPSPKNLNWNNSQLSDKDNDVEPPPPRWKNPAETVNAPNHKQKKNYKLTIRRYLMMHEEVRTFRDQMRYERAQQMLALCSNKEREGENSCSERNNDLNSKHKSKKDLNLNHRKNAKGAPRSNALSNKPIARNDRDINTDRLSKWEIDLMVVASLANQNCNATNGDRTETRPIVDTNWKMPEEVKEKSPMNWESFREFPQDQPRESSITDPRPENAWGPDPSRGALSLNTNWTHAQGNQDHASTWEESIDIHVRNSTKVKNNESRLNSEPWEEENLNAFWNPTRAADERSLTRWNSVPPREKPHSTSKNRNQTKETSGSSRSGGRGFDRYQSTADNRTTMKSKEPPGNEYLSPRRVEKDNFNKVSRSTVTKRDSKTSNPSKPKLKVRDDLAAGKNWIVVDEPTEDGTKNPSSMASNECQSTRRFEEENLNQVTRSCNPSKPKLRVRDDLAAPKNWMFIDESAENSNTGQSTDRPLQGISNSQQFSNKTTGKFPTQITQVKEVRSTKWDGVKWVDAKVFDEMNKAKANTNLNLQVPVIGNSVDDEILTPEQLQVSIVDGTLPGRKLEPDQWEFVEKRLLQLLDEVLIRTSGPYPIFDQMTTHKGFKILACSNKFTLEWLKANVAVMRGPWPGSRLNVMAKKDLPTGPFVKILLPGPPISKKRLEQFMRNLNPEFPCENWYVIKLTDNIADNGQEAIVLFNEESLALLPDRGYKIRVGISVVNVYALDDDGNMLPKEKLTIENPFRPESLNEETKKDSDTESKKSECWDD